jgi:hypothetical protein
VISSAYLLPFDERVKVGNVEQNTLTDPDVWDSAFPLQLANRPRRRAKVSGGVLYRKQARRGIRRTILFFHG